MTGFDILGSKILGTLKPVEIRNVDWLAVFLSIYVVRFSKFDLNLGR
jgi:hypothetical protein